MPRAFVRVRVPIDEFVELSVVNVPVAADSEPVVPIDPADRAFVMIADAAENAFVTPRDVRVEAPAEKFPDTPKFPVRESVVFLSGVYPNAVVMSDDDRENVAVRFDSPSLVSVRVLCEACGVENEIAVT